MEGVRVGIPVVSTVGTLVGGKVGSTVGRRVGRVLGSWVGETLGAWVGGAAVAKQEEQRSRDLINEAKVFVGKRVQ